MEIIYVLILVFLGYWIWSQVSSGNRFRDNAYKIVEGLSSQDVVAIMGDPSFVKYHSDGSFEYIYEKSEWKGYFRGGTITRRMEIVFNTDNTVISVGRNEHCYKSGW